MNIHAQGVELVGFVQMKRGEIMAWLKERADMAARREDRLETVEWAILVFAIAGVATDVAVVAHEFWWLRPN